MRVLAAFTVVVLHVTGVAVDQYQRIAPTDWWIANAFNATTRWAVPVFFMLSGSLLLGPSKREDAWTFYRKRAKRVLIPLLGWSVFYILWRIYFHQDKVGLLQSVYMVGTGAYFHMRFLYLLLGLYLFVPFIRVFIANTTLSDLRLCTFLLFALCFMAGILDLRHTRSSNVFADCVRYLPFFMAGLTFRYFRVTGRVAVVSLIVALVMIGLTAVGTRYVAGMSAGESRYNHFHAAESLTCILTSLGMFMFLSYVPRVSPKWLNRTVQWIAPHTLGIYLVHPVFMDLFNWRGGGHTLWPDPGIGVWLWSAVIILCSLAITWGINGVPYLRRING